MQEKNIFNEQAELLQIVWLFLKKTMCPMNELKDWLFLCASIQCILCRQDIEEWQHPMYV